MNQKHWIVGDLIDFDVFRNLRNSGIEITVSVHPGDVIHNGTAYQFAQNRFVEAITTTSEQETLLMLSCNKLTLIK